MEKYGDVEQAKKWEVKATVGLECRIKGDDFAEYVADNLDVSSEFAGAVVFISKLKGVEVENDIRIRFDFEVEVEFHFDEEVDEVLIEEYVKEVFTVIEAWEIWGKHMFGDIVSIEDIFVEIHEVSVIS